MIDAAEDGESLRASGGAVLVSIKGSQKGGKPHKSNPLWDGLAYSPDQGDQRGPLPTVLGLTRTIHGRQQRIVVAGDADFLSNSELARSNIRTSNFEFSTAIFSWFSNGEFPIDTSRPPSKDKRLELTDKGLAFLKVFLMGILPGIILVLGTVLLIRRKRK
jgi:ABC-2 type transport system permease protein